MLEPAMMPTVAEVSGEIASGAGARAGRQIELVVGAISDAARDIRTYEFLAAERVPAYEPGAHIDLYLPNGLTRSYSLVPAKQLEHTAYAIAVKRDPGSRGGSRYMHDQLSIGDRLRASPPRNHFPLVEDASHSVLFAGGIGITPIWSMIAHLRRTNRPWSLFYSSRTRSDMAFVAELEGDDRVHLHFDDESRGGFLDIKEIVANLHKGHHLYCCGPAPMLRAFEEAAADWPKTQIHTEYFLPKQEAASAGGFTVCLARSEREFFIPEGTTILQVLMDEGIDIDCSCEVGICGTCAQRVVSGIPDHRDSVLSSEQQEKNDQIIVCCSGSKSERLVLDL
jgi:ferredoxin-NADP reductase